MNKPLKTLDRVTLDGKPVAARRKIYLLLYKPKACITTYKNPQGRPTVYDLISNVQEWLFPVGRLDLDTSGLLILTNGTQFAERMTNPQYKVPKTCLVRTSTRLAGKPHAATNQAASQPSTDPAPCRRDHDS